MFRKIFYLCIPKTIDNRIFMQLSNYHSHCTFCDGRSTPEDFVKFAISHGFRAYGFSSHSPLPFETFWNMSKNDMPEYLAEIDRLKKELIDIKYDALTRSSELMEKSRQSRIEEYISNKESDLQTSTNPPYLIK